MKKYRIWYIANIPRAIFYAEVVSVKEAKFALRLLISYSNYLDKLISSHICGLEVFKNGEWEEWGNNKGQSINDILDGERS